MKRMLDLCSGLGGASAAMRNRGWDVVSVDIDPSFNPSIVADIRDWSPGDTKFDLIWASPPCTEFSREFMPWSKRGIEPDISIVIACKRIINECAPEYWVIENVQGSVRYIRRYLGEPSLIINPYYLWGTFPPIGKIKLPRKHKQVMDSERSKERAVIPYRLSFAFAFAIEKQLRFVLPGART